MLFVTRHAIGYIINTLYLRIVLSISLAITSYFYTLNPIISVSFLTILITVVFYHAYFVANKYSIKYSND